MDNVCRYPSAAKNPALMCAVLQVAAMEQGKNVGVMMPYSDNLKYLADWYCQLWAESLGKNVTLDGKPCNVGQTPVKSLGVTDQHSQVQLYTEGPFDKVVTFISVKKYACEMPIPHGCESVPDVAFLGGHTMQELIQAENEATAYALTKAGRMNYTLWVPEINAFTLGQLLFLFELRRRMRRDAEHRHLQSAGRGRGQKGHLRAARQKRLCREKSGARRPACPRSQIYHLNVL